MNRISTVSYTHLIPAIIVGGLILGFRNIIGEIRFMNGGTETLIEVSQFWAGVHSLSLIHI